MKIQINCKKSKYMKNIYQIIQMELLIILIDSHYNKLGNTKINLSFILINLTSLF